jgi:acetoin:2,6-dichlorophenolindophenol oxidoreductase subunit alpha
MSTTGSVRPPGNNLIDVERGTALYFAMLRIRAFERGAWEALKRGDIPGTLHLSIGQESVAVGVCSNLRRSDLITSTHRGHGHVIAKGADLTAMMAELFGRATGTCRGKGGSMHIADFGVGMLGANGVVAGGLGIAVGAAQALRLKRADDIVACFFGDGAVNRGPFLEALNWAQLFRLPVLFVCEDNGFAAFTRASATTAGAGPAARAEAIGMPAITIDASDVVHLDRVAEECIAACRAGGGPRFLHCRTYRLEGHTVADGGGYRPVDEVERHRARDPIRVLRAKLAALGIADEQLMALDREAEGEVERAISAAGEAPWPQVGEALDDVQDAGAPSWRG